jgi:hypothetical protein
MLAARSARFAALRASTPSPSPSSSSLPSPSPSPSSSPSAAARAFFALHPQRTPSYGLGYGTHHRRQ